MGGPASLPPLIAEIPPAQVQVPVGASVALQLCPAQGWALSGSSVPGCAQVQEGHQPLGPPSWAWTPQNHSSASHMRLAQTSLECSFCLG